MSDALSDAMFASPAVVSETDDDAWLRAMRDVEAALARAGHRAGIVPDAAAAEIEQACRRDPPPAHALAPDALTSASPVVPLVEHLGLRLSSEARDWFHLGATSQDIVDTAACLVARRACTAVRSDLHTVTGALARLATDHRDTVHIGRTLWQQAAPTTFGLVCAGWLTGVDEAHRRLARVCDTQLACQLGGPVGTLDTLGPHATTVLALLAEELDLTEPTLPWHTDRYRIGELATALGGVCTALGKVALDVGLLSQTEVGELAEGTGGASSAMAHKRNPARSVLVTACSHQAPGLVTSLLAGGVQQAQRSAGQWQAEWPTLTQLLRLAGGTATHAVRLVQDLQVDTARMRRNVDLTDGLVLSGGVTDALAGTLGRGHARRLVAAACTEARRSGRPLRTVLRESPEVRTALGSARDDPHRGGSSTDAAPPDDLVEQALDRALDPTGQTGVAEELVQRAVRARRETR